MLSIYINSSSKRRTRRKLPYYPLPCDGRVKINATTNFLEGSIVITKSAFDIVNTWGILTKAEYSGGVRCTDERRTIYRISRKGATLA